MPTCPKCSSEMAEDQAFCEKCGAQLKEGVERKKVRKRLGSLAGEQHKKYIRSARIAIMAVAVLTVIGSVALWFLLQSTIEKVKADPTMVMDEHVVAGTKIQIASTFVVGLVFFGLFFWAKSNPFGASLTALVIYLTLMLVSAALDPTTIARGIIIKIIITLALIRGVQSGLAFRKLER